MRNKISRYSDIIDLPHHQSARRPHMSVYNRAAQFAPFAALVGYDEMVQDTAGMRLNDGQILIAEDRMQKLDEKLKELQKHIKEQPEVMIVFYDENAGIKGGRYLQITGKLKKIEEYPPEFVMSDGKKVPIASVIEIYASLLKNEEA